MGNTVPTWGFAVRALLPCQLLPFNFHSTSQQHWLHTFTFHSKSLPVLRCSLPRFCLPHSSRLPLPLAASGAVLLAAPSRLLAVSCGLVLAAAGLAGLFLCGPWVPPFSALSLLRVLWVLPWVNINGLPTHLLEGLFLYIYLLFKGWSHQLTKASSYRTRSAPHWKKTKTKNNNTNPSSIEIVQE